MPDESSNNNRSSVEIDPLQDHPEMRIEPHQGEKHGGPSRFELFWEQISHAGLIEPALRVGTVIFSIVLVLIVVWGMGNYLSGIPVREVSSNRGNVMAAALPTATPTSESPFLPSFSVPDFVQNDGISRLASLHTTIPTRPRVHVITYSVELGDSVFGIAEKFSIKPETILWANTSSLRDNPHRLQVDQVINILPVNGTYHKWTAGENLQKVAEFYGVSMMDIIEWPGNPFDLYETDFNNLDIPAGTMLIVPGGQREMIDYGPPRIPRDNPAIARTYGPGHCGVLMDGLIGDGLFMWPAPEHWLSGYDYSPSTNHYGIDIAGDTGHSIWAADDGVVVYSGWSYSGYGNLIVLDHGNDWQTLYAHLDTVYVGCGESVYQGATIATMGNTGNSSGSHLHFEMLYGTQKVNPWNFLP